MLVMWEIWKERNGRVFQRRESSVPSLLGKIKNEVVAWRLAGAKHRGSLFLRE
ncbi:hypothetical protein HU200_029233 [Digitaria exilis]|uniref:Uncharacterized protein n=1 Tax=Digitaria exilis TaxID=1010633 RepID=A0A835BT90_9POAL|nr:hypothetical protein HU200_029233 [Digitaria exilis]